MRSTGAITAAPNPIQDADSCGLGTTTLRWWAEDVTAVEVRVNAPDGVLFSRSGAVGSAQTGPWVSDGMVFYLQDVSNGSPLTSAHTLATITVKVATTRAERSPAALILMYHRVAEVQSDPWALCVTPQHFAEQLEVLRQQSTVWGLRQLSAALRNGSLPKQAVVITFDDGYADNLHHARPLLESFDTPATVFLTTGAIGCQREFWWDELERLLLQPGSLPATLHLKIGGDEHQWELGAAADYDANTCYAHSRWRAWGQPDLCPRHSLYRSLYQLLYPLPEPQLRAVQDELLAWAGAPADAARPSYLPLSKEEAVTLAKGGLIEIGAHTVTHSLLAAAPLAEQELEIRQSKSYLEEVLERPITSFAYPFGKRSDYTEQTVAIVREAGFDCACSNFAGVVSEGVDHYQLPRMYVADWDGEEFAKRLSSWLER
jgi:peptidoglycan/xylan/chitin deacetylase (PgdA/CDA1 family)